MQQQNQGGLGSWLVRLVTNIPIIVSGIEKIHGDAKSGAEKKQLALEALGLAGYTAGQVAPSKDPVIGAAMQLASNLIDDTKSVYNAATGKGAAPGAGSSGTSSPAPAPGNGASLEDPDPGPSSPAGATGF